MAEPSAVAVAAVPSALGIGVASLFPGVDLNAVIGAWAGALFFVTWARDLSGWGRLAYLFVSWVGGYYIAAELMGRAVTQYSGLPALLGAAFIVTALIGVVEWGRGGLMPTWLRAVIAWARRALTPPGSGGSNG
ncbi:MULTISPECIES: putative holin [unclassified Pseudomonas]|uniref:putative holin n=1 Tax=unclassified Pseudomonas TaxID=196821 RepID=UPI0024497634|nr:MULTISPECIES: putative holin [unclassified Pseudomonas]MDG9928270.1 phage holin family protein [Pseudomonas sp. GD04042]MDH0481166.1 phage holin family protein [Pseudomonas sp. GD04015]MDH0604502.1 phage holin family protein [Pseudomonas sp. GD03869]